MVMVVMNIIDFCPSDIIGDVVILIVCDYIWKNQPVGEKNQFTYAWS